MSEFHIADEPLDSFRDLGLIEEELFLVKGGKEAVVHCCRATPPTGRKLVAAKVYRPLEWRTFKNDAVYQEGRVILNARSRRAYQKKTRMGREVQFAHWVGAEWGTLCLLHGAGADVPAPLAQTHGAILMEYLGDEEGPAPPLLHARIEEEDARRIHADLLRNVEVFLDRHRIHADLSPYNVLYWGGKAWVIDFPQAIDPRFHPDPHSLLLRDLENIGRFFERFGIRTDASRLADDLWARFMLGELG